MGKFIQHLKVMDLLLQLLQGLQHIHFSAGGPFIYPDLELITITPICPHTRSMHTIVLKGDSIIEICADHEDEIVYLTVDGQKAIQVNHETDKGK